MVKHKDTETRRPQRKPAERSFDAGFLCGLRVSVSLCLTTTPRRPRPSAVATLFRRSAAGDIKGAALVWLAVVRGRSLQIHRRDATKLGIMKQAAQRLKLFEFRHAGVHLPERSRPR